MEHAVGADGTPVTRYARIIRVAELTTARPYELRYEDGALARSSRRLVSRGVLPQGFEPASIVDHIRPAQAMLAQAVPTQLLPARFDLAATATARRALTSLMPGDWSIGYMHALVALHDGIDALGPDDACLHLPHRVRAIVLESVPGAVDPWPHATHPLARGLAQLAPHFAMARLSAGPLTSHLHPQPYRVASLARALPYVLTAPSVYAADLIIGLSVNFAAHAVFALVPLTYVSHAPGGRRAFLTRLSQAGRLRLVLGVPVVPGTVQMAWLCMFADRDCLNRLVRYTPA
jgi:hypothetical protein